MGGPVQDGEGSDKLYTSKKSIFLKLLDNFEGNEKFAAKARVQKILNNKDDFLFSSCRCC